MDPATFAMDLSDGQRARLASKAAYLSVFGSVTLSPDQQAALAVDCPLCETQRSARGPLTAACPNLVRCGRAGCLAVSCSECRRLDGHGREDCPAVIEREARLARLRDFDPSIGRTCPYEGCGASGIQHYRGDGCHIMACPLCARAFCFVCGLPKRGSIHDAFQGRDRDCRCPLMCCGPHPGGTQPRGNNTTPSGSECPCVAAPGRPEGWMESDDDDEEEREEGGDHDHALDEEEARAVLRLVRERQSSAPPRPQQSPAPPRSQSSAPRQQPRQNSEPPAQMDISSDEE